MASKAAHKRLTKEYVAMQKQPPPFVFAAPEEKNILTWNFLIRGPPDCPFAGGEYHGVLLFPSEYPFKPPGIKMYTPSGRFQPDKKICFSMSDFHPGTWNPAWSVATILTGLLSFMLSDEMTTGSVTSYERDKKALAARSHEWNRTQKRFIEAFPDYCGVEMKDLPNMGERERGVPPPPSPVVSPIITTTTTSFAARHPSPVDPAIRPRVVKAPTPPALPIPAPVALGWTAALKEAVWNKWRWGVFLAVAVMVSRLSSS